jgi:hypothetical protein
MKLLSEETIDRIILECLFTDTEAKDRAFVAAHKVVVEGIVSDFGFYRERLEAHREEVKELLAEITAEFFVPDGWPVTKFNLLKDGTPWCNDGRMMEALMALGIGLGYVKYCLPSELWFLLPGGVPYLQINLEPKTVPFNVVESVEDFLLRKIAAAKINEA